MTTTRISTSLGRIHVELSGNGPAMLCWPSLLMTGSLWNAQAAHFGRNYSMVLIDPPGHGQSEALTRGFTMEECALCVTELLDALGHQDCVLLGNSWGGMMGGVFAALYPRRTRAAVLMNCSASAASANQRAEYKQIVALLHTLDAMPDALMTGSIKAFAGKTSERTKPDVVAAISSSVRSADPRSVAWAIESVVPERRDQHALLAQIIRPVLVVAGEEDRTFRVAETRSMAEAIPGSEFRVLPQVGHLAALEAPDLVNTLIDEFLARI